MRASSAADLTARMAGSTWVRSSMAAVGTRSQTFLNRARSGERSASYEANGCRQARRRVRRAASVSRAGSEAVRARCENPVLALSAEVQGSADSVPALHLGVAGRRKRVILRSGSSAEGSNSTAAPVSWSRPVRYQKWLSVWRELPGRSAEAAPFPASTTPVAPSSARSTFSRRLAYSETGMARSLSVMMPDVITEAGYHEAHIPKGAAQNERMQGEDGRPLRGSVLR